MTSYLEALPSNLELFYDGSWHEAVDGATCEVINPATGELLGRVSQATEADVDLAVRSANAAFRDWRSVNPLERAGIIRQAARIIRDHADELALIDAADSGGPYRRMIRDSEGGAAAFEYFAGLVTEIKGATIPVDSDCLNYTLREPLGVIARINAFNHPFLFAATHAAPPLAAGNAVIIKPPDQAPLSTLRMAELIGPLFPAGVISVLPGDRRCGEALVRHPLVAKIGLIGSVPTGKAIARGAADTLKEVALELGGKNALIAFPDADPERVAAGIVQGMNFTWCGQSCGSTSRVFLHESLHDKVVELVVQAVEKIPFGLPTDPETEMGCLVNRDQLDKTMRYVALGIEEGAHLETGGYQPDDPQLSNGFFYAPTVFTDVRPDMRIAREEIFGPVLSILRWHDETQALASINELDLGLTASIWTSDLARAHRFAADIEAGYIWVNNTSKHFAGAPFGGYKQSGQGREESIEELLACTQIKNVNVSL